MTGESPTTVWFAELGTLSIVLGDLEDQHRLLTDAERQRALTIQDGAQRRHWVGAHVALHLALIEATGRRSTFAATPPVGVSKPRVEGWNGDFSLAHSGGLVAIAVSDGGPVGIDIERRRHVAMTEHRRAIITAAAVRAAGGTPLAGMDETMRFLSAWTRLEALAKARGSGMAHLLARIGLLGPAEARSAGDATLGDLLESSSGSRLAITDLVLGVNDAVAALASPADAGIRKMAFPTEANALALMVRERL